MGRFVYMFHENIDRKRNLFGNKGARLSEMYQMNLPVPNGFVITTEASMSYYENGGELTKDLESQILQAFDSLSVESVAVRSSGIKSMPGMLDSILEIHTKSELVNAVKNVFDSWNHPMAIAYRNMNQISHQTGMAIVVQAMVFGDKNDKSGTGVLFTRNPSTGKKEVYGEYLIRAQGHDLVSGVKTPRDISVLQLISPKCYKELLEIADSLERHYKDMQDIEFTIENEKLYVLQTRDGKRTRKADFVIINGLKDEGILSDEEAKFILAEKGFANVESDIATVKIPAGAVKIGQGLPAVPGFVSGKICFSEADISDAHASGHRAIFVSVETSPNDVTTLYLADGILTAKGGMTSHAAVIAREKEICCVAGCINLCVSEANAYCCFNNRVYRTGDFVTLNGCDGYVYNGDLIGSL